MQALVNQMEVIEGATYDLISNDTNDLQGILFQDTRMKEASGVVLFDATYKLNNRHMPLGVMMVIDGNGESQVAALVIIKSENSEILITLFEKFKEKNPDHVHITIIMCDKSMADKRAYDECFPNATQQICIFHVRNIFKREITTQKRKITSQQRDEALQILGNMVYSKTEAGYMEQYQMLLDLGYNGK